MVFAFAFTSLPFLPGPFKFYTLRNQTEPHACHIIKNNNSSLWCCIIIMHGKKFLYSYIIIQFIQSFIYEL